jgi:hypothetical protein
MSRGYMLLPAFLMHVNGASGIVIDIGSGILVTNRALHSYLQVSIVANY